MMLFNQHMEIEEFGVELIRTGDLDPVYVMLYRANLPRDVLAKWLLAYWWFYHSGVASQLAICDSKFYEEAIKKVAACPRGTERRHFRGAASISCLRWFSENYPEPEAIFSHLEQVPTFEGVKELVTSWPMFGPWIAFKVADMLERVWGIQVHFDNKDVLEFYDQPREAAHLLAKQRGMESEIDAVVYLESRFSGFLAPPRNDRPIGIQEIETILCKWKSHCNGHYPVGKDTREIMHHLQSAGPLGARLLECLQ